MKVCILSNEVEDDHLLWILACKEYKIDYKVVNLTRSDWLKEVTKYNFDYFLAKPSGLTSTFKQLYDERIFILSDVYHFKIYPTPLEIFLYENKRFLYSWLEANDLPHPKTLIFYNKDEALQYIRKCNYPIVGKTSIGASGSGVKILRTYQMAHSYILKSFSKQGIPKRWGPNLEKGHLLKRLAVSLLNPKELFNKVHKYLEVKKDVLKNFVILQEFIPHDYEWRIVVIGDSYFAHKKIVKRDKASGTLLKEYSNPPFYILDFAKSIMERFGFVSQAIDAFETERGKLIINEMQCIFGQSDPYQMLVNGVPGRYRFINNQWVFEKGDFAKNACYNLRIEHVLSII